MRLLSLFILGLAALTVPSFARDVCTPFPPPPPKADSTVPSPAKPRALPTAFQVVTGGEGNRPLVLLGDSMISGGGGTSATERLPHLLSNEFTPPRAYLSYAIGGQTSDTLAGLFRQVSLPPDSTLVIWMGRNNLTQADTVLANIRYAAGTAPAGRYLIIPILHSISRSERPNTERSNQILELNKKISQEFAGHVVYVEDDIQCVDYADNVHLSATGNEKVAAAVREALHAKGW